MQLITKSLLLSTSVLAAQLAQANAVSYTHPMLEALRTPKAYPPLSYQMKFQTGEAQSVEVIVDVDLSAEGKNRVKLVSSNNQKHADSIIEKLHANDNDMLENVWCSRLVEKVPSTYSFVEERNNIINIKFRPVAQTEDNQEIYPYLQANLSFATSSGQIAELTLKNETAFKASQIAKIRDITVTYSCSTLNNGMSVLSRYSAHIKGKALFQRFDEFEQVEFSKFQILQP